MNKCDNLDAATILFLGNNDETTDHLVTSLAHTHNRINHGLITDAYFEPNVDGYYHTSIADVPFGLLLDLAQRFDTIVLLDQPQSQWSHWKCLLATFKLMVKLEELQKHTVFRDNHNCKKIFYWTNILYKENKSFCIYPWINLHNNGKELRLCSRDSSFVTKTRKIQNWNNDVDYTAIRQRMIDGTPLPAHCSTCYNYEQLGIESYRQFESLDWLLQLEIESFEDLKSINKPYFYEFHSGNDCNIKCRGCQPAFSKPIGIEIKKFNIVAPRELNWTPMAADLSDIDIDTLDKNSSVYFQGGEPTIMPEVRKFMTQCIEKNKTDFFLTMCTNGVKLTDEFLDLISNFSNTNFSFSLDGFGQINNYWRSGSQWDKVISNAHLLNSRGNFISINTVPGIYNVTNLHWLLEFLDREFPFTSIYMQINYLSWQSAYNHPNAALVVESMEKCMNTSVYQSHGKSCKTAIDSIYNHYKNNPKHNNDHLRQFFEYNDQLDRARGVKLIDYIPELEACRQYIYLDQ